jgi:hypothetical protein
LIVNVYVVLQNEGPDAVEKLFRKISQTESDCSSAKNGGDLGSFSRGVNIYI